MTDDEKAFFMGLGQLRIKIGPEQTRGDELDEQCRIQRATNEAEALMARGPVSVAGYFAATEEK